MQLASLKVFCDVARQRSFSLAAHTHGITQSAVSQIVSHLERNVGVQLIDRSTRPLQLTPLGQAYLDGCSSLLEQYDELEARIRSATVEIAGTVHVAAIYSVGLGDMHQYEQRFRDELPRATVHLDYLHPDRVMERVQEGTADLGLVSFPKKAPNLVCVPWRTEEFVLVCSPKHPLGSRVALPLRELDGLPYVHFDKNLVIRRRVDRFLREHGVTVEVKAEFDNIENIKQAVVVGAGVALLPEPTIRREMKSRALVALPLQGASLQRPLAIIHRRGQRLNAASKRFMEMLLEQHAGPSRIGKKPEQS